MKKNKISFETLTKIICESIEKILKKESDFDIRQLFDFSKFTKEQLLGMIYNMRDYVQGNGYGSKIFYDKGKIINEQAERTLDVEELKSELNKSLGIEEYQIKTHIYANKIKVVILYVNVDKNTDYVVKEMESCGWSLARKVKGTVFYGYIYNLLEFDPMFQDNVNNEVRQSMFLYHWTPIYNLDNILKHGLEPRSENEFLSYLPHVYLMKTNISVKDAKYLGWQLYMKNKNINNDGSYVLLQIYVEKIPEDVDFFYDPRYEMGYYTNDLIPPEAINAVGQVTFDKIYNENIKLLPVVNTK